MRTLLLVIAVVLVACADDTATLEEAQVVVDCHIPGFNGSCHAACAENHTFMTDDPECDASAVYDLGGERELSCRYFEWRGLEGCCVDNIRDPQGPRVGPDIVFAPCK